MGKFEQLMETMQQLLDMLNVFLDTFKRDVVPVIGALYKLIEVEAAQRGMTVEEFLALTEKGWE